MCNKVRIHIQIVDEKINKASRFEIMRTFDDINVRALLAFSSTLFGGIPRSSIINASWKMNLL